MMAGNQPSQRAIWTLADKPSGAAERNIRKAVIRLGDWLRDLPDVKINRSGSELIIKDVGLTRAAVSPIAYDSNTRSIEINERCRFWDDPKKSTHQQYKRRFLCSNRANHLEMHEVGHAQHHHQSEAVHNELKGRGGIWPRGEQMELANRLSMKAAESPIEFVSEFYTARRLQIPIKPDLLAALEALYGIFAGPTWE
ncbi:MAG: hypothetical protein ACHRXM_13920 [Isosphaerales bacterium]